MASSSSTPPRKYEVFLSFRGEDTRNTFVSHLHMALKDKGIITYMDEYRLENGQSISQELPKSIQESKFAIIVFSKNYASSTWCLNELAKIMECKTTFGLTVIPIFYDVDPSDVRKIKNSFAESFVKHEANYKDNVSKVQIWKDALILAADIKGVDVRGRNEASYVTKIAEDIFSKLRQKASTKYLRDNINDDSTDDTSFKQIKEEEKCYMLRAKDLQIEHGDNPHWHWISIPESRFNEVAELQVVWWLEIRGQIRVEMLSFGTTYAAYLVFKFKEHSCGFGRPCKAFVRFTNGDQFVAAREFDGQARMVYLKEPSVQSRRRWARETQILDDDLRAQRRMDGWMEIKLGEFDNNQKNELDTVEIMLWETDNMNRKEGLIVQRIELRPVEKHNI